MVVAFRTRGDDWERFAKTLRARRAELEKLGCIRVEAYRNRKHPDEWFMIQEWPDKTTFDSFAQERGPALDREAGVRWTDVSTWLESAFPDPEASDCL